MDYFVYEGGVRLGRVMELPENVPPGEQKGAGWIELDPERAPRGPAMQMRIDTPNGPAVMQLPVEDAPVAPSPPARESISYHRAVVGPRVLTAAEAAPMRDENILEIRRADGSSVAVRLITLAWMQVPSRASRKPLPFPPEFWVVGWHG